MPEMGEPARCQITQARGERIGFAGGFNVARKIEVMGSIAPMTTSIEPPAAEDGLPSFSAIGRRRNQHGRRVLPDKLAAVSGDVLLDIRRSRRRR